MGQKKLYLVSALMQSVREPNKIGHRALVEFFDSEELAIGSAYKRFQTDGMHVADLVCTECVRITEQFKQMYSTSDNTSISIQNEIVDENKENDGGSGEETSEVMPTQG